MGNPKASSNQNKKKRKRESEETKSCPSKRRRLNKTEPPEDLCDPITYKLMKDPTLVTLSGYTYEREIIEECIKEHGKDPMTNVKIEKKHLVPNRALKCSITRWKENNQ